jgi:hypothetical protein
MNRGIAVGPQNPNRQQTGENALTGPVVVWHAQEDGRGHYNCTQFINDIMDANDCGPHLPGWHRMPDVPGAIVIVHGGKEEGRFQTLQNDIAKLDWVLLIFLGDEDGSFPAEMIQHPNMKWWVQEPIPGRHDEADRFLLDGYTPRTLDLCWAFRNGPDIQRDLDWVFAGQVTHERRRACVDALRTIDWGGMVVETKGYCQGVSIEEYHRLLWRAQIVPCPSGPCAPDAARAWEALECGAIPILDEFSPRFQRPGFWTWVLGDHPLPVINDWSTLPNRIKEILEKGPGYRLHCQDWWMWYKEKMKKGLAEDLSALRSKA